MASSTISDADGSGVSLRESADSGSAARAVRLDEPEDTGGPFEGSGLQAGECSEPPVILVIEPQTLFRRGLCLLLRQWYPHASFVDAADIATASLGLMAHPAPDLVLVDAASAVQRQFLGLTRLVQHVPSACIVLLANEPDRAVAAASLRVGARGYLSKAATEEHLQHALALVMSGESYAPPDYLLERATPRGEAGFSFSSEMEGRLDKLTLREREVAVQLSQGRSNKEIGLRLGMLENTVKVHLRAILKKLSVRNRTEAAMLVLKATGLKSEEAPSGLPPTNGRSQSRTIRQQDGISSSFELDLAPSAHRQIVSCRRKFSAR